MPPSDNKVRDMPKRNDPISNQVAGNIARLRQAYGYTGTELAERCAAFGRTFEPPIETSMNFGTISKIESGDRTVSITEMFLFAGALAVTTNTLMAPFSNLAIGAPSQTLEARVTALEVQMVQVLGYQP